MNKKPLQIIASNEGAFICPVCGFPHLCEEPYPQSGGTSDEICPSCGFLFGYDDHEKRITFKKKIWEFAMNVITKILETGTDDWFYLAEVACIISEAESLDFFKQQDIIRERAMIVIRYLLEQGLVRVGYLEGDKVVDELRANGDPMISPNKFETNDGRNHLAFWNLSADDAIKKIRQDWLDLGRPISLWDVCWFENTKKGDARAHELLLEEGIITEDGSRQRMLCGDLTCDELEEVLNFFDNRIQKVVFTYCSQKSAGEECKSFLKRLIDLGATKKDVTESPGARLVEGQTLTAYILNWNSEIRNLILETRRSLFGWRQPDSPEDLSFLDENNIPLLLSISHKQDGRLLFSYKKDLDVWMSNSILSAIYDRMEVVDTPIVRLDWIFQ